MMKILIILLSIYIFSFSQVIYELEPVVVTATRYPKNIMEITRTITIIDSSEIKKYTSLPEMLKGIAGINLKIRGDGIQADPSIRGSTFQQVLIMIDGVKVNDPQTGHHNLNTTIPLNEIERIEILHGTASSLYGSDACGGVINIITKRTAGTAGYVGVGSFGYKNGAARISTNKISANVEMKSSDGHQPGYEYSLYNIVTKLSTNLTNNSNIALLAGYLNKDFGAKNFYAPYPSWEKNQAFVATFNNQWFISQYFMLNPTFLFRTHIDTFTLDRNSPLIYANRHQSFTYGALVLGYFDARKFGYIIAGTEILNDSVNSTRLKNRKIVHLANFIQWEKKFRDNSLIIVSGIRDDHYSNFGYSVNPQLSFAYKILPGLKLSSAAGGSFRVPSFTELYYQDPANLGDSLLKPEQAWEYEIGASTFYKNFVSQFTFFLRKTENDIDWVKRNEETVWQSRNIGHTQFYGFESSLKFALQPWFCLKTGLSYIKIVKQLPEEYISKYSLQIPMITINFGITIFSILALDLSSCYYKNSDARLILNLDSNRGFSILRGIKLMPSVAITNLLNKKYEDYQGVPLPGRSLKITISLSKAG